MSLVSQIERLSKLIEHKKQNLLERIEALEAKQNALNYVGEVTALITEQTCELCYVPNPCVQVCDYVKPPICLGSAIYTYYVSKVYPLECDENIAVTQFSAEEGEMREMPLFDLGIEGVDASFTFHDVVMKDFSPIPMLEGIEASFNFSDVIQRFLLSTNLNESVSAAFTFHDVKLVYPITNSLNESVSVNFSFNNVVQEFV